MGATAVLQSPTIDEPFHLVRGLAYWQDARLSYAHPPLVNAIVGFVAGLGASDDLTKTDGWQLHDSGVTAKAYMRGNYPHARAQIVTGRLATIALTALFFLYVFFLARRHWGEGAAIVTLVLMAANPTVLAHGAQLTNDLGATAFFVLLIGESLIYLKQDGWRPLIRCFIAMGTAAVAKFNLLPFVTLIPLVSLAIAWHGWGRFSSPLRSARMRKAALEVLMAVAVVLLIVNASYFFRQGIWTRNGLAADPALRGSRLVSRIEGGTFGHLPRWMPVPLPATYCAGLSSVGKHAEGGHRSWFMGKSDNDGSMLYFPVLLVLKTPVVYGLLLLVGGIVWWRQRADKDPLLIALAFTSAVYLVFLLLARINIGVRHALPIVPCVALAAGRFALAIWEQWQARWSRVALGAVVVGTLAIPVLNFPDFLGYFNLLVGRPLGHRISMIGEDWGQNTVDLARDWRGKTSTLYYGSYPMGGLDEMRLWGVEPKPPDLQDRACGPCLCRSPCLGLVAPAALLPLAAAGAAGAHVSAPYLVVRDKDCALGRSRFAQGKQPGKGAVDL